MSFRRIVPIAAMLTLGPACGGTDLGGSGTGSSGGLDGSGSATGTPTATGASGASDSASSTDGGACNVAEGAWGDCVNAGDLLVCEHSDSTCLQNRLNNPIWGVCSLECTDACDCWAAPSGATAKPACVEPTPGKMRCVLDCNDEATCPDGMRCLSQTASIKFCVYDNENPDTGTGTGDTGGSGSGSTSGS